MKIATPTPQNRPGITLLEMSVVLIVLLGNFGLVFVGARAWMNGSERTETILTIRNAQRAVRSQQAISASRPGDLDPSLSTSIFNNADHAYIFTDAPGEPPAHPVDGQSYQFHSGGKNTYPELGTLYINSVAPQHNFTADELGFQ